jgi:hypothetical protein
MYHSEEFEDLITSLGKAQASMQPAPKDSENSHFKNKYADLASIFSVIKTPFASHGLVITQENEFNQQMGGWVVWTVLRKGKQWLKHPTPILMRGNTSMDFGSAETYARRQGLQTLVGVAADDDDDGVSASLPAKQARTSPVKPKTQIATSPIKPKENPAVINPSANTTKSDGYIIPFGPWKGLTVEEAYDANGPKALEAYVKVIKDKAAQENKPIQGDVAEFIKRVTDLISCGGALSPEESAWLHRQDQEGNI